MEYCQHDQLIQVFQNVSVFLNQNDLFTLSQVSQELNQKVITPQLYKRIRITKDPVLRSDEWDLDYGTTYISGYRGVIKSSDQNDMFLYDKIERLIESSHLDLIEELCIEKDTFLDIESGYTILHTLIDKVLSSGNLEIIDIRDPELLELVQEKIINSSFLKQVQLLDVHLLPKLINLPNIRSLECMFGTPPWSLGSYCTEDLKNLLDDNITELVLTQQDWHFSSFRIFRDLYKGGFSFKNLTSLKFSYYHCPLDFTNDANELLIQFIKEIFNSTKITKLEMTLGCGQPGSCHCLDEFLELFSPLLIKVNSLGLIQYSSNDKGHHYKNEEWDLAICKFLSHIPDVGKNLKHLLIQHDPAWNGMGEDNVDGNYIRRRELFNLVLPRLQSLRTLIVPRMLQSVAPFEVIACDFLWNGCTCSFCQEVLPKLDEWLMNHQYFNKDVGKYKDIIPSRFVGYIGEELYKRLNTSSRTQWSLSSRSTSPTDVYWNFHNHEQLHHFEDYDCSFDETWFKRLTICITHFFNGYMYHLVQHLPQLRLAILSGIYYSVDSMKSVNSTPYIPNHQSFFTTNVDTSSGQQLKCPIDYHSVYD